MSDSKSEPIVAPIPPADREGLKTEIEEKITEYEKKYADAPPNSKLKGIYLNMIEGLGRKLIEAMSLPTSDQSRIQSPLELDTIVQVKVCSALPPSSFVPEP